MIIKLVIICVICAFSSFLLTRMVLYVAKRNNVFDNPSDRKIHDAMIPRFGGIAIVSCFFLFLLLVHFFLFPVSLYKNLSALLVPALIIFVLGVYDDLRGASAPQKFLFQIISALLVYSFVAKITFVSIPFIGSVALGKFSLLFTVLWIVLSINAFNLIDGLDGLLVRISLYASVSLAVIFFLKNENVIGVLLLGLAGSLLGFLPWNLYPAKIFMGDTGSMFLGFVFAVFSMVRSQKGAMVLSMSIPLIILFIPLFDTCWAFLRRIKEHKSPFVADKKHVHHRLLSKFGNHKKASFVLSSISGIFSVFGIVVAFLDVKYRTFFVLFALLLGVILILITKEERFFFGGDNR